MHRCNYCGDKVPDTARCCFKCGNLNPYNKENIEKGLDKIQNVEKLEIDDGEKENFDKIFSIKFRLTFIFDILYLGLLLYLFLTPKNYMVILPIILIWWFYRIIILKHLLHKSGISWWGVYIPIYGFCLYNAFSTLNTHTLTNVIRVIGYSVYIIIIFIIVPIAGSFFIIIYSLVLLLIGMMFHIKICDGLCYRFNKSNKYKKLLIFLWPIVIVNLAFNKDVGLANFYEN